MKIEIDGTSITYRYKDDWDGTMDESDVFHVETMVAEGYVEGELCTGDPKDDSLTHYGWWKIDV